MAKAKDMYDPIFPEGQKVQDKDHLVGKEVSLMAYHPMEDGDDKYNIVLAGCEGKPITFASGSAINSLIERATKKVGVIQRGDDYYFKEPIQGTFTKTKTADGKRSYYNIE